MTGVLVEKGNLDTETCTQGEDHVEMKAAIGMMSLQTKEGQRLAESHQNLVRSMEKILSQPLEGTSPALILDF